MIAHVALVYAVYALVSSRRVGAVRAGRVDAAVFRERRAEPDESVSAVNNLANQFELPVLFHLVCLCFFVTEGVSALVLALAWAFVVSRYLHTFVHVGGNRLRHRRPIFIAGFVVVALMWLLFAWRIATT
ncbi:MAG TPA: MAPEG family protein [Mesorhizobium sp.]|jgi:hypothetical protein|nr:MAPEG family protein [Mesorhizobium sp.]